MVDIVFLMIIFFMLVSTYISAENIDVELPQPDDSVAVGTEVPERVVLNCQYDPTAHQEVIYLMGPQQLDGLDHMEMQLMGMVAERPDIQIILRADRRIRYGRIREAMEAVARTGVSRLNIAAEMDE
jgi:biopolymer transport protein TolR